MSKTTTLNITLLATILTATGCDNRNVNPYQQMPDSTLAVLDWVSDCENAYEVGWDRTEYNYQRCVDETDGSECSMFRTEEEYGAIESFNRCLKNLPMVSFECVQQLDPTSRTQDTDGDGIADYWEYSLGLNPCEPCSYGGTPGINCDADMDWDRDGVANGQDTEPRCGQMSNGEWHTNPEAINGDPCI